MVTRFRYSSFAFSSVCPRRISHCDTYVRDGMIDLENKMFAKKERETRGREVGGSCINVSVEEQHGLQFRKLLYAAAASFCSIDNNGAREIFTL